MNLAAAPQYDPFASSLAGRRLGRYEVLARLASGGMAGVYVARAIGVAGFERVVAIKVLHPHLAHEQEFISMFLDEARLAARIRHPNVVPTTDISDTQDAGYYLVMDYIEGDHLGAILQAAYKAGERLTIPVTLRIVMDGLSGLAAAHALTDESGRRINLVHRDISPHNIMVGTDGISRLTDFGVAKAEVRLSTTREGQFKGKLAYMSPEHASSGQTDQRSDLFSMGIILWECLTGRRLFRAENHAATLNLICLEPIPLPSTVDRSLAPFDAILAKALDRDPDQRFQTAEDFADAVEHVAHSQGGLGTARTVGKVVREYVAEKLEKDREVIQTSIAALSMQAGRPQMPEHTHQPQREPELDDGEVLDALDDLEEIAPLPPAPVAAAAPSKAPWIAFGIATLAVVGAAVAYVVMGGGEAHVTTSSVTQLPRPTTAASTTPSGTVAPAAATAPVPVPTPPAAAPVVEPAVAAAPTVTAAAQATPPAQPSPAVAATAEATVADEEETSARRRRSRSPSPSVEPAAAAAPRTAPTQPAADPAPREPATRKPPATAGSDDLFLNPYRH